MSQIIAHRGDSGHYPENTMKAFKKAVVAGCDAIELDVQRSKDGELVVIHDETVNRTTDGTGYVKDLTLKELRQLKIKKSRFLRTEKIPMLDEVLHWLQNEAIMCHIELKNDKVRYEGMEKEILQKVAEFKLDNRIVYSSFNLDSVTTLKKLDSPSEVAFIYNKKGVNPLLLQQTIGADAIHANYRVMTEQLMRDCQRHGFPVRLYTLNQVSLIQKWMDAGLSGVITDFPGRALQLKKEK
ncbi:glycerophosphodiester phosphodiesterase [Jeotgalibacillus sp. R-1-5s-1]|uniref:glycerophosphodiester phosphodiesterase n=1 Tax=Jeotgalibacillus sp. R-1-5s-1 TaxID=2555897 RepID=UPI00106CD9EC|nr:glycerophosphodiester phosphodiesterase [Jeotgalibacillus sp. R-1-5s-1]TFD92235.1 glycerophosphodiester phosphodiesterase [Jeotgalibacillus sp. R-1-5s-1]